MKLYHYMDEHYGLKNLSNRRIKVSTFDNLNDPFELLGINTKDRGVRARLQRMKNAVSKEFGILCFSKIWSNPVQWAHYANNHRGMCIELEVKGIDAARRVEYVNERFDDALMGDVNFPKKLLLSKFKHWQYEEEYRKIGQLKKFKYEDGLYFEPFSHEMKLRKVIIGCQSKLVRGDVFGHLSKEDSDVPIIYARAAFKSFKIVEHKNK
ncbi:DUF2971 domain-containing protein [Spongiibacter sp. UBA1325]|uniref:DUF2971 domain-containing protein n=1 Tax=Spongiibacter sp. UBA1325 TaxID=1947543 RepID=UPI0025802983|nr:DUF2971 domain-containing protein [Spongiibacter sp. UBA1325]|tara:strand:- start:4487 stop:5113 length:627 start_codon:yes stop_codon:yes gene_type:complete